MAQPYPPFTGMTPQDVASARQYGTGLMQQGTDASPVGHWTQALARVLQGGVGGYEVGSANKGEAQGRASGNALLAQALQGGDLKSSVGSMLSHPWAAEQGGKLAQTMIGQRIEDSSPAAQARLKSMQGAEQRATAMHPLQVQEAQLGIESKRRELDNPAASLQKVKDAEGNEILVQVGKRPGDPVSEVYRPSAPAPGQPRPIVDPKKKAEVEHTLRGEVQKLSTPYRTVRDASGNIEEIAKQPSAASDIAMIFAYMKILDPNSVVRETEFATAQNAAGVPDRIKNVWNRILEGQRLNPQQRQDFLNQARSIAKRQTGQYQRTLDQYKGVADRSGVDFRNVVVDQDLLSGGQQPATGNSTIGTPLNGEPANSVPVLTPDQASKAPPGTVFRTNDGRVMRVPAR